jgi:hypothetical protein
MASLKAAKDIAEAMVGLRDAAAFQAKAIEFQSKIIDIQNAAFAAQEERSAFVERVGELEKQVARLEAWEAEKQRYELKDAGNGALAYALKGQYAGPEPAHWICASCYEDSKKSILQPETRFPGLTQHLLCHRCEADLIINGSRDFASAPRQTRTERGPRRR